MDIKAIGVRIATVLFLAGILLFGNHVKPDNNSTIDQTAGSHKVLIASKGARFLGVSNKGAFSSHTQKADPQIVPIFTYHHVVPNPKSSIAISPEMFDQQLKLLADNGYQTISLDDLYSHISRSTPLPPKPVILTFDDSRKNQYQYAIPLLNKYKFKATFFVYCKAATWNSDAFMNEAEIADISRQGFEVESHTWSHASLTRGAESIDAYNAKTSKELTDSRDWLEQKTGKKARYLAYPYGFYDCWAIKATSDAGYALAVTVDEGTNILDAQPNLAVKRFVVAKDSTLVEFMDRLQSKPLYAIQTTPVEASVIEDTQPPISATLKNTSIENTSTIYFQIDGKAFKAATTSTDTEIATSIANKVILEPGFHTVVLKGRTKEGNLAVTSWSFFIKAK